MDPSVLLMMFAGRWMAGLTGAGVASAAIWYLFPMVPALRPAGPRIVAIVLAFMLCLGINGALSWRRRRRERKLKAGIAGEPGANDGRASDTDHGAAEVVALRDGMREALAKLRRRGRRSLYDQPWYVLIGPPGSGKTTALRQSGLHFPLGRDDEGAVGGVGGTRLCDWWFADEAVLIDTAGRYTTQDSQAAIDRAGWQGFLELLRRTRPRQPLNGIIVVLSLTEIAAAGEAERGAHARAVRRRIDEVTDRLRVRLPVYVIWSKADQLAGFDIYFDDLDAAGRDQVWGATFKLEDGVDAFAPEFRLLLHRLEERLVERLQAERSAERRALIAGFPLQVASLEQPLLAFMTEAFSGSRLDPAPMLRGAYFTSATQEGMPMDRLTGLMTRSFGIDQARLPSLRPVRGRGYFVSRLMREVILGEAMLMASPPGRRHRQLALRASGFAAVAVLSVAGTTLVWRAGSEERALVQRDDEALAAFRAKLDGAPLDPVRSADMTVVVPLLDEAAALRREPSPGDLPGLSQGDKLAQAGHLAYARALERILLPRLIWRLERRMRSQTSDPDALYATTRVYLMLGGAGPLDAALVRAWMAADWQAEYPGTLNDDLRAHALEHLNALLAAPLPAIALDGGLVEGVRATFSRVSPAARIYGRIREEQADSVPPWTPLAALQSENVRYFATLSGRPLDQGIPGLYTAAGLHGVLLRDLPRTARAVAAESWVLGRDAAIPTEGPTVGALEEAVLGLWANDARRSWDRLLGDLALTTLGGRDSAIQKLYILGSPRSPLRDLLGGIGRALGDDKPGGGTAVSSSALLAFQRHFAPLLALSGPQGNGSLDAILHLIDVLEQELAAGSGVPGAPPAALGAGNGDPAQLLLGEASRQPPPVSRWLRQVAAAGIQTLGSEAHSALTTSYTADDGPGSLCPAVVDGRYPFDPSSGQDAPIGDFIRLFAPGGALDATFQSAVKPYADTRGPIWRVHDAGGVKAPVDRTALAAFQRAASIRAAFFPAGAQPLVAFTLAPAGGASTASSAGKAVPAPVLMVGSASVEAAGSATPASFSWPGADGLVSASLRIGSTPVLEAHGPWALFRLLGQARVSPGTMAESYTLTFPQAEGAVFRLQAGSARNPFADNLLAGFRCPVVR